MQHPEPYVDAIRLPGVRLVAVHVGDTTHLLTPEQARIVGAQLLRQANRAARRSSRFRTRPRPHGRGRA
jgi:hypothetical protein